MSIDKTELEKLSPAERIKKLKELGAERKKEIEEAEDLIKRTEAEIERERTIPDIELPEFEPVDISKMFQAAGGLEGTVAQEAPAQEENEPVKYSEAVEHTGEAVYHPDEHDWVELKGEQGISTVKYESASNKADDLTGSRSVLKNIKKYVGN